MQKVVGVKGARDAAVAHDTTATAVLAHDERHLRRKTIRLSDNTKVLIDLPKAIVLQTGDVLMLEDGSAVQIEAADEPLFEVRGQNARHLLQLAWHIGNRHLPAEINEDRILILRDHVIRSMLEGLGASVVDITGPFVPTRGAYDGHSNGHGGGHDHGSGHSHEHGHHHHHHHG